MLLSFLKLNQGDFLRFLRYFGYIKNERGIHMGMSPCVFLCNMATAAFIPYLFNYVSQKQSNHQSHVWKWSLDRWLDRNCLHEICEAKCWVRIRCRHFRCVILDKTVSPLFHHLRWWKCILSKHMFQSQSSLWHPLIWSSMDLLCCRQKFAVGER